jgi:hypothetical protein
MKRATSAWRGNGAQWLIEAWRKKGIEENLSAAAENESRNGGVWQ